MNKIDINTLFVGQHLHYLPKCQSTNTLAIELLEEDKLPEGSIILTDQQLAGKGQRGNSWESAPNKNLTFSLIFYPTFLTSKEHFLINIFISNALQKCLKDYTGHSFMIKWPNDIYYQDQKIGGILIENILNQTHITRSIVGIGLNINQKSFQSKNASSLATICHKKFNKTSILSLLLVYIEQYYLQLRQQKFSELKAEYLKYLYRFNEEHLFKSKDCTFKGKITGIDDWGRLEVMRENKRFFFDTKEIIFL